MSLDAVPLFAMLKARMGYETQRQGLLGENVANADTAGYAPRDLSGFTFAGALRAAAGGVDPARTHAAHLTGRVRQGAFHAQAAPDGEVRLDGNQVVLEEEMAKMSDSRGAYDAAVTLYQQSLNLLRTAARAPGR